jgi:23S rRNA (cytosine1962-C5)-methyltransferase
MPTAPRAAGASGDPGPDRGTRGEASLRVLATPGFADYALIDSGNGRKLERFGRFTTDRPEPQAMWQPVLEAGVWLRAHAQFKAGGEGEEDGGRWRTDKPLPPSWPLNVAGVCVSCRLTPFRHLGIFPEQLPHWLWMQSMLKEVKGETPRVLNLFAYTGAASLIAAAAGAEVTHLDASKTAITWAKQNQAASKLGEAPIRWIVEDARKFVAREVRRGKTYHLILVDPPKFGRGPAGETWEIFEHLGGLLRGCALLLAPGRGALVLTTYAIRASALAFGALLAECMGEREGTLETGELVVVEQSAGRLLPTSHYARWTGDGRP